MNKDTKEAMAVPAKLIDSVYQSLEDGSFNAFKDFSNFIDDIIAIQPAVDGITNMKSENASMPVGERDEVLESIKGNMPNVPETDRYDIAAIMGGSLAAFRLGWRKGATEERAKIFAELKAGTMTLDDLEE